MKKNNKKEVECKKTSVETAPAAALTAPSEEKPKLWKVILYTVLSFLAPALIMLYAFYKREIHPFGDNQMLVVDLWHQYYPFFRVLREKLLTGGSFMYSWENGMGTNFLSLISYYAASPLNWISVFFDDEHVRDSMTYILIAKIGFAGAFFSCFLRYTFKRCDLSLVPFSAMFALCAYTLGYYWNVMWFDTIALFPLVMLGVVAMCREGKWKLYTIALALSLISNYYVGYFTCIFTVFMFFAAVIIESKGIKNAFRSFWLILRSTVLGIGIGAFMLLPAYFGLQLTYSVNNTFPTTVSWYEKWQNIFGNLLSYSAPTTREGLPNIATGMLALALIGVFIFSAGIKIREKIAAVFMLALIIVSCNMNMLNFIWHGFHVTNQLPYRFSFIFSFVLAAAAYRAFDVILRNGVKIYQIVLLIPVPAAVFFLNWYNNRDSFEFTQAIKSSLIITGAYLLIFIAAKIFPFKKGRARNAALNFCIAAAVLTEVTSNTLVGTETVGTSVYSQYPAKGEQVSTLLEDTARNDSDLFYRTEMTGTYTLNDSAAYGYRGVSQFSSSANVSVTRLFRRLGLYASEAGNRYYYRTAGPVVNDLLGLKYIISKYGMLNSETEHLQYISSSDDTYIYRNDKPLSLGFMMNKEILEVPDEDAFNPFEYQNDIIRLATGADYSTFVAQPVELVSYNNIEVTKQGYGNYSFTVPNTSQTGEADYSFAGVSEGSLYGYVGNGGIGTASVNCGDITVDSGISIGDYPLVFPMGEAMPGTSTHVKLRTKDDCSSGSYKLMVYSMDEEKWNEAYEKLADEQLLIKSFSDTKITGRISVKEDGILYLSIPYENGWRIWCDGQEVETVKVLSAMLGAELPAGEHEIRLEYTPEGFVLGTVVSAVMLLLFILLCIIDRRRRKAAEKNADSESAEPEKEEIQEETDKDADDSAGGEKTEESEDMDGVPGDEVPRVPETEQRPGSTGDTGGEGVEGTE
ncbi:MAG TPA: hypothetical protein DCZ71_01510 [Ruminococcus sp.]|nr:hypothetical protein [Ruminococcus sp.]